MKLEEKTGFLKTSEDFKKKEFTIAASATAFQVLSSQLYTNKARAIIRELSCNAVDAMRAAGTLDSEKFIIHLPSQWDPTFRIRDFGTGISPEDIDHVYTQYFSSTKRDSNEQIGCLGLGSKTPFCYTDNFQVHSYVGGVKYSYAAVIDDSQMPQILKVSQAPTLEKNGLEIIMAVKQNDVRTWQEEAINTFIWFEHLPKIENSNVVIPKFKNENFFASKKEDGWSWKIISHFPAGVSNAFLGAHVLMGGVLYKLDQSIFQNASPKIAALSPLHLIIEVPIGDVTPAANRETLHLDNKSKASLKTKLSIIADNIIEIISKEIDTKSNFWEATSFWLSKSAKFDYYIQQFISSGNFSPSYKGKKIKSDFKLPQNKVAEFNFSWSIDSYAKKITNIAVRCTPKHRIEQQIKGNIFFIYKPKTSNRNEENIVRWILTNPITEYKTILPNEYATTSFFAFLIDEENCDKTYDEVVEIIGCDSSRVLKIDELKNCDPPADDSEEEEEEEKQKKVKKKDEAYYYLASENPYDTATIASNVKTVDLEEGEGYYFSCYFKKPIVNETEVRTVTLNRVIQILKRLHKDKYENIYGFTESQVKKVKEVKNSKWKDIFEEFKNELEKIYSTSEFKNYTGSKTITNVLPISIILNSSYILDIEKKIDKNHEIKLLLDEIRKFTKSLVASNSDCDFILANAPSSSYLWSSLKIKSPGEMFDSNHRKLMEESRALTEKAAKLWEKYPALELAHPLIGAKLPVNVVSEFVIKCI